MASNYTLNANSINSNSGCCVQGLISGIQNVVADGSNISDATVLTLASGNIFAVTGANITKGVLLPQLSTVPLGQHVYILNKAQGINSLHVYAYLPLDTIWPNSASVRLTLGGESILHAIKIDNVTWFVGILSGV